MLKRPFALALAVVLAVLVALAVTAFVWAKSYAPLAACCYYGPGYGVSQKPVMDDNGFVGLVMRGTGRRVGEIHFRVGNDGPWTITIVRAVNPYDIDDCRGLRAKEPGSCFGPIRLRQPPARKGDGYALSTSPFRPVRVPPHATTDLWVRFQETCHPQRGVGPSLSEFSTITLVYRYLGRFERSQTVGWPFSVDYAC